MELFSGRGLFFNILLYSEPFGSEGFFCDDKLPIYLLRSTKNVVGKLLYSIVYFLYTCQILKYFL